VRADGCASAKMYTAIDERCFPCGLCLDIISGTISGESEVEYSEVKSWLLSDFENCSLFFVSCLLLEAGS
jgi:hypothetical protein